MADDSETGIELSWRSNLGWTQFGCGVQVVTTISQGKIVWDNDKLSVEPGSGRFIRRQPFAPHIYTGLKEQEANWISEEFPYGPVPVKRKGDKAEGRDEL